jgi:Holliday junction resolvase RusA-like endonuclease
MSDQTTHFTIPGEPKGKARARSCQLPSGHTIHYTPDGTVLYENLIKMEYKTQSGVYFGEDGYISIMVIAYFRIPLNTSRKTRALMESGVKVPKKKPDVDNILKVVCDALNGIAYQDDAQIVAAYINKKYSDIPRVEVTISRRGEDA